MGVYIFIFNYCAKFPFVMCYLVTHITTCHIAYKIWKHLITNVNSCYPVTPYYIHYILYNIKKNILLPFVTYDTLLPLLPHAIFHTKYQATCCNPSLPMLLCYPCYLMLQSLYTCIISQNILPFVTYITLLPCYPMPYIIQNIWKHLVTNVTHVTLLTHATVTIYYIISKNILLPVVTYVSLLPCYPMPSCM